MPTATPAPPDQCRTASTTRSGPIEASTTSSAPWNSARSSDAADTSTAHTSAPRARATATAASPTPPQPMTSTLSPPSTFARCGHGPVRGRDPAAQPGGRPHVEVVGQPDEVGRGGVDDDELGERARVGEAGLALLRAHLAVARGADGARPAGHDERGRDPHPDPAGSTPAPTVSTTPASS